MPPAKSESIRLEFRHHGHMGSVRVKVSRNHGVLSSGFTAIDKRFTDSMVKGFPVMKAEVNFEGSGYEALFGWLQVISHDYGRGEEEFSVDIADQFREFMNPFCYYGYKPAMYDAPRHAAPGLRKWKSYTFLCPLSLSNREEYRKITPLAGFTWGYTMFQGKPESIMEPMPASRDDWNLVRRNVASYYPQWLFMDMQVPDIR